MPPLSDVSIRSAKSREKPYKLHDERGLFLIITPTGGRWWRFKYRFDGREKLLSLGVYPDVQLRRARDKRDEARRLVAEGIDPSAARRAEQVQGADSFEGIARDYLAGQRAVLTPKAFARSLGWLERHVFPFVGGKPIAKVTAPDLLTLLKRVEGRGNRDTAHRIRSLCGAVFRYAISHGKAERDPAADLRGALAPRVVTGRAAITEPARVGELLRAIDTYRGQPTTEAALKLAPLLFVRPGELRAAEWREFALSGTAPEWRIPAARMKSRREHLVPLPRQAVAVLHGLEPLTGGGRYVFPSLRGAHRPLSENTLNVALRALGFAADEMTAHGFRAMASTLLNELGYPPDVIELQLAHKEQNEVRAAYNRAKRLQERRKMIQAWADYLDGLKAARPRR